MQHRVRECVRKPVPAREYVARNGDRLDDLNDRAFELQSLLRIARDQLREQESKLRPFRETIASIETRLLNIQTRLNIWWGEYEGRR